MVEVKGEQLFRSIQRVNICLLTDAILHLSNHCRSWITTKALPDTDLPTAKELIFTVAPCENKDSGRKGENGFHAAKR